MAKVAFTPNLRRHISVDQRSVAGNTISELMHNLFESEPLLRGYILDDQGNIRKHINIFLDNTLITDLEENVRESSEVFIMQALSGG